MKHNWPSVNKSQLNCLKLVGKWPDRCDTMKTYDDGVHNVAVTDLKRRD